MRTSPMLVWSLGTVLMFAAACGPEPTNIVLPTAGAGGTGGTGTGGTGGSATAGIGGTTGGTGGTGGTTGGVGGTSGVGGSVTAGAAGAPPLTGGVGGSAGAGGSSGGPPMGGMAGAGADPAGGMAGTDVPMGGMAGTGNPMGGMAGTGAEAGGGGAAGADPYRARTGSFKMLAYSNTEQGFTHTQAIAAGKTMLMAMGTKQGFEVTFSDNPSDINAENLAEYEILFGLNPTGIGLTELNPNGKADFEEWMTTKDGAFAGVHSSTDHERNWAFWSEVTGQYYDSHEVCCSSQNIQWDAAATTFIAVVGLPSPWQRSEEWYFFNSWEQWSAKPGFKILSRVTSGGRTRPVSYIREWSNFRSFYTSLGHEAGPYSDANFIRHVSAGIMWAVRREALFVP